MILLYPSLIIYFNHSNISSPIVFIQVYLVTYLLIHLVFSYLCIYIHICIYL